MAKWQDGVSDYLQDLLAVLYALLVPTVKDTLHAAVAHPIIQAGEEAEADGAGHGGGGGGTSPALIEGLPREGRRWDRARAEPGICPHRHQEGLEMEFH